MKDAAYVWRQELHFSLNTEIQLIKRQEAAQWSQQRDQLSLGYEIEV